MGFRRFKKRFKRSFRGKRRSRRLKGYGQSRGGYRL